MVTSLNKSNEASVTLASTLDSKRKFPLGTKKSAGRYSIDSRGGMDDAQPIRFFVLFRKCRMMVEKAERVVEEGFHEGISHGDRRAHQKAIGQGLRKFFNAVVAEPIPDEFLILLQKMDEDKKDGAE